MKKRNTKICLLKYLVMILIVQLLTPNIAICETVSTISILLLGSDSSSETLYGHTDCIMIMSINLKIKKYNIASISRDILIPESYYGLPMKINSICLHENPYRTMCIIGDLLSVKLSGYVYVRLEGLATIIDLMGGIDITLSEKERVALNKGLFDLSPYSDMSPVVHSGQCIHLNGNQAVAYSRIRIIDSDEQRMERQRNLITSLIHNNQNLDLAEISKLIPSAEKYIDTNISISEIIQLLNNCFPLSEIDATYLTLPVVGTFQVEKLEGVDFYVTDFPANAAILSSYILKTSEYN